MTHFDTPRRGALPGSPNLSVDYPPPLKFTPRPTATNASLSCHTPGIAVTSCACACACALRTRLDIAGKQSVLRPSRSQSPRTARGSRRVKAVGAVNWQWKTNKLFQPSLRGKSHP